MSSYDDFIERREGLSGGYPVLKRVRVSVRVVVEMSRQVADFQRLCQALPQCTPKNSGPHSTITATIKAWLMKTSTATVKHGTRWSPAHGGFRRQGLP